MSKFEISIQVSKNGDARHVVTEIECTALDPVELAAWMREMARTLHHDLVGQGWVYPRSYKRGQIIPAPANWFERNQVLEVGEM